MKDWKGFNSLFFFWKQYPWSESRLHLTKMEITSTSYTVYQDKFVVLKEIRLQGKN